MTRFVAAILALLLTALPARAHDPIDIVALTARLLPSVVSIAAVQVKDVPASPGKAAAVSRKRILGSGFVIDPGGLIVTNKHVIAGASEITVTLSDGTTLAATVLSRALVDIALLKVEPEEPLTPVVWGNSDSVRQGMPVIAIGNPLGYSSSVTAGIISALERDIRTSPYDDYLQTDASINQGNSGGPLFNMQGQVIGINTALQSQNNGGSIGIGFAIPSNDARFVVGRLLKFGRVKPGWVGARVQKLTPALASAIGLPANQIHGVIVTGIDTGGSAAGRLRPGDVVLDIDGSAVDDARNFNRKIGGRDVGSTSGFVIWRNGAALRVEIPIIDNPDDLKAGQGMTMADMSESYTDPPDLGLGLAPITTDIRERYSIAANLSGVAVVAVDAHSHAAEVGIEQGDVILRVMSDPVASVRTFWQLVDAARRARHTRLYVLVSGPSGERWVVLPSA